MKKFIAVLFMSALFLGFAHPAMAMEVRTSNTTVAEDDTIEDDLYIFGDSVEIEGTVMGDVITSGGEVDISGVIEGDLYVSGGMVDISGSIERSLFVAGGQIDFSGNVGRSIYITGGDLDIGTNAQIQEDVNILGGQMKVDGDVGDDVRAFGGSIKVDGNVSGDLMVGGGDIDVNEDNVLGEVSINQGEINWDEESREARREIRKAGRGFFTFRAIFKAASFIGMYFVGLLFIYLAPVKTKRIVDRTFSSVSEAAKSLLFGLIAATVLLVGPAVLFVTLIGAPLGFLMMSIGFLIWSFGTLFSEMGIGRGILGMFGLEEDNYYLSLLGGRGVTLLLGWIPCINFLYKLTLFLIALGAIVRMKMKLIQKRNALVGKEDKDKKEVSKKSEKKSESNSKKKSKKKSDK